MDEFKTLHIRLGHVITEIKLAYTTAGIFHLIWEEILGRQLNDFIAISFTDLHFNTKLRTLSGISPTRIYDIALMWGCSIVQTQICCIFQDMS